jgi:hypothetical protein
MREITTQEATAVVGGVQEVQITRKKDDGGASTVALMGAVHNSGGNSAGSGGGGGGGSPAVTTTVTCVDTIVQVSQAATGPKSLEFGLKGLKVEVIPKIENVTRTSVCTTVKTQSSR